MVREWVHFLSSTVIVQLMLANRPPCVREHNGDGEHRQETVVSDPVRGKRRTQKEETNGAAGMKPTVERRRGISQRS